MNKINRTYYEREAIKSELLGGNMPRIEYIQRALESYKGKMFKVDGVQTQAFKKHLEPLQLNVKSSGYYAIGGLKTVIHNIQVRAGYSNLELHIRARSNIEGENGINYIEYIMYLGNFDYGNYKYDFNTVTDRRSIFELTEQIEKYNPYSLEHILDKRKELDSLQEQITELKNNMPYYSYN